VPAHLVHDVGADVLGHRFVHLRGEGFLPPEVGDYLALGLGRDDVALDGALLAEAPASPTAW